MRRYLFSVIVCALCISLLTGAAPGTPKENLRLHIAIDDGAPLVALAEALNLTGLEFLEFTHGFVYGDHHFVGGFKPGPHQSSPKSVVDAYRQAQDSFVNTAIQNSETLLLGMAEGDWQHASLSSQLVALRVWAEEMERDGIRVFSLELEAPPSLKPVVARRLATFSQADVTNVETDRQKSAIEPDMISQAASPPPVDSWVPTDGYSLVDEDEHSRYTYQYFGWAERAGNPNYYLRHFKDGGNHTFEQETHYDGWDEGGNCWYPLPLPPPSLPGYWGQCPQVYANDIWQGSWNSNLPRAYYDTTFSNNPNEPNLAVGTADASLLQPGQWYWYWIRTQVTSPKEGIPFTKVANDRISIVSQRGKRIPSNCYDTWCSFAEEFHINKTFAAGLVAPSSTSQHYWPYQTSATTLP